MERITARILEIKSQAEAKAAINKIGCDPGGLGIMIPKAVHRVVKVENIRPQAAQILKQEMLSKGGEVAVPRGVIGCSVDLCDVLLLGTKRQYSELCKKLKAQPFRLQEISQAIQDCLSNYSEKESLELNCRGIKLPLGKKTLVMGILNITPNSFSDGGRFFDKEKAVEHALEMIELGADIIDIGGESTNPRAEYVPAEEEIARVLPILEALVPILKVPISVDTYKPRVARACLDAGAHIINDIWGLQYDKEPEMAAVVGDYPDAPVVIMHNQSGTNYQDLIGDMFKFFMRSIELAKGAGIMDQSIILDPGIGFGKTTEQNLQVMARLGEFKSLGYPILLGTSRKSMIGNTLDLPSEERVEGTGATVALGIAYGCDIMRIHDVKEMTRICRMTDAIVRSQRGKGYAG